MVNYPAQIDNILSLPPAVDDATSVSASVVNRLRDAILATQTELGVKPSGTYTTVRNRLDYLEDQIIFLAGDLGGTKVSPLVIGIQGRPIASTSPNVGQGLVWNGSQWAPTNVDTDTGGSVGGSDTQVQFNDDGYLAGDAGFTYNKTTNVLTISDALAVGTYFSSVASEGEIRLCDQFRITQRNATDTGNLGVLASYDLGSNQRELSLGTYDDGDPAKGYSRLSVCAVDFFYVWMNNEASPLQVGKPPSGGVTYTTFIAQQTNLALTGNATITEASYGGGVGIFYMGNANTVPTTNPDSGIITYVESGVLKYRKTDGTVVTLDGSGGGGTPGGSDTQIQFNDGGTFGGDNGLTWNKTTNVLNVDTAIAFDVTPATSGNIRLPDGGAINARDAGDTANVGVINFSGITVTVGDRTWGTVSNVEGYSAYLWGTNDGGIYNPSGSGYAFFVAGNAIAIGNYDNVGFNFDGSGGSFGGGTGVIYINNASVDPTTDPANGAILYSSGGALNVRNSDGRLTEIGGLTQSIHEILDPTSVSISIAGNGVVQYGSTGMISGVPRLGVPGAATYDGVSFPAGTAFSSEGFLQINIFNAGGTDRTMADSEFSRSSFYLTSATGPRSLYFPWPQQYDESYWKDIANASGQAVTLAVNDSQPSGLLTVVMGNGDKGRFWFTPDGVYGPYGASSGGGGGSPGGSTNEIQVNNGAGGFTGATNVTAGTDYIGIGSPNAGVQNGIDLANDMYIWGRNSGNNGSEQLLGLNANDFVQLGNFYDMRIQTGGGRTLTLHSDITKFEFGNTDTQAAIFSDANLQFGPGLQDFGGGQVVIGIDNCTTIPTSDPTDGIVLYVEAGDLKYRKPDGRVVVVGDYGIANPDAPTTYSLLIETAGKMTLSTVTTEQTGNTDGKIIDVIRSVDTTDATVTDLYTWTILDDAVTTVDVVVTAVDNGVGAGGTWKRSYSFRSIGGTVTAIGSVHDAQTDEDSAGWDVTIDTNAGSGRVRVTGAASTNINWYGSVRVQSTKWIFTPQTASDCLAWYDALSTGVVASGSTVLGLIDQGPSGDSNRVLIATSVSPSLVTADPTFGNRNVIEFTGTEWLETTTWSAAYTQPTRFYIVGQFDVFGNLYMFDSNDSTVTDRQALLDGGAASLYAYAGGAGATSATTLVAGTPFVACVIFNGASSEIYINDPVTPSGTGDTGTQSLVSLTMGSRYEHVSGFLDGKIAALGAFDGIGSTAERTQMFIGLKARYGIP